LYVTSTLLNSVSVIDTEPASPTFGAVVAAVKTGTHPHWVTLSPDGTRVYVTNRENETVAMIDTASNAVPLPAVKVGRSPAQVALSPDGTRGFVANLNSRNVTVIDTDPTSPTFHAAVATVTLEGRPFSIAIAAITSRESPRRRP